MGNSIDDSVADFLGDAVDVDATSLVNIPEYNVGTTASSLHGYVTSAYNYVSHVPYVASMPTHISANDFQKQAVLPTISFQGAVITP